MIFLASGTIRDGIKGVKVDLTPRATESGNPSRLIGLGIVVTLSNPYWTLWWLTIGASLISASASGNLKSIGAFYTGHILADFVWYGMVGAGVVWGGRFLAGRAYGMLLVALGGLLGLFGCYFLLKGAALIR
jgi:threonine/homoserine/homoserine lactone efflux protein